MNRNRGNVQLAAKGSLIKRLNIFEPMLKAIAAQVDFVFRHRVKHEGVIRVWRMAQGENFRIGRHERTLAVGQCLGKGRASDSTTRAAALFAYDER